MRRVTALATLALVGAAVAIGCASAGAPPGGPERHTPPAIVSISPESGKTNVNIREVEFKFDEVVSDRPSGAGAELDQIFLVSPRDGSPNVSWHRSRITVRPRKGFRPNTAYRVTMLPGLADLRGNVRKDGVSILFSTGATFPAFSILGRVFDWEQQKPVNGAYIEAISQADTSLVYVTATDTAGMFDVGPLGAGTYVVRALVDQNANRAVDPREKWDTTTTNIIGARPTVELDVIERDTTPPAFANVAADDSVTLRVAFDKPLSPRADLATSHFRVQRADSSLLQLVRVTPASVFQREKATADSLKRAAADTGRRPPTPVTPAPPPAGARPAPAPPKPKAPPPENTVFITVSPTTPLVPGRYVIYAQDLPNLVGRSSAIRRGFTIAPPAPRDTLKKSPADSARRPPPGRTPR